MARTFSILSNTSSPPITRPKIVYLPVYEKDDKDIGC